MFENLNDENVLLYAAKSYSTPNAVMSEFEEDFQRVLYIKRLLTKYYSTGVLKDRLIMNHLVVIFNVFGLQAANRILFLKLEERDLTIIKPFLVFLNFLPEKISGINGKDIFTDEIKMDQKTIEILREIK